MYNDVKNWANVRVELMPGFLDLSTSIVYV